MILISYLKGLVNLSVKIFIILFLIFVFLELVERSGFLTKGYKRIVRFIRFLGFSEKSSAPLFAGIFFGIIYGAGTISELIKREGVSKKEVLLVSVFLAMCHAIFEDTGLFLALGANILWLTLPRIILACLLTFLVNRCFDESS